MYLVTTYYDEDRVSITDQGTIALGLAVGRDAVGPDGRGGCRQCGAPERDCLCCMGCGADADADHLPGCPDDDLGEDPDPELRDQRAAGREPAEDREAAAVNPLSADMAQQVREAAAALGRVSDLWIAIDHTGDYFAEGYPFGRDLLEVVADVQAWAETIERGAR